MRRIFFTLILSVFLVNIIYSQQPYSFDDFIDFDITIKDFSEAVEKGITLKTNKFVLLVGSVGSIYMTQDSQISYIVELINGEWLGTTDVKVYRVYMEYSGDGFSEYFDRRNGIIKTGSRVLAVGLFMKNGKSKDGNTIAWLKGIKIKVVD